MSVYLTDVLFFVLLLFWVVNFLKQGRKFSIFNFQFSIKLQFLSSKLKNPNLYLFLFIIISAISIKNFDNYSISWFQWGKLVEFIVFYYYLSRYAFSKFGLNGFFLAIITSGVFQSIIAYFQYAKRSNIGFKYLGESFLSADLPGVASFIMPDGEKIIRAYGTTPHPNVLAIFLLTGLFGFYLSYLYIHIHREKKPLADGMDWFLVSSYVVMLFGFLFTFSRTIIFAWLMSFLARSVMSLRKNYINIWRIFSRDRLFVVIVSSMAVMIIFSFLYQDKIISRLLINSEDQAVQLRGFYNSEVIHGNISYFGIGTGNFINWMVKNNPYLPYYAYQPVHNIYLLIYSENGILGISAFLLFLFFSGKRFLLSDAFKRFDGLAVFVFIGTLLFIGFFDHMFWTLQQGRFVFWSALALGTFVLDKNTQN